MPSDKGYWNLKITILLCPSRFHIIGSNFDGEYIEVSQPLIGSFNQLDILSTLSSDRILNPMKKRPRLLMILSVEIFNTSWSNYQAQKGLILKGRSISSIIVLKDSCLVDWDTEKSLIWKGYSTVALAKKNMRKLWWFIAWYVHSSRLGTCWA